MGRLKRRLRQTAFRSRARFCRPQREAVLIDRMTKSSRGRVKLPVQA
jgi:hypothetical protein